MKVPRVPRVPRVLVASWVPVVPVVLVLARQTASAQQLPPGPGAEVFKSRCVICHEADIITSQKLSLTGWTNSIDKMVRWGSQITPESGRSCCRISPRISRPVAGVAGQR